jgi:hypothetical protein
MHGYLIFLIEKNQDSSIFDKMCLHAFLTAILYQDKYLQSSNNMFLRGFPSLKACIEIYLSPGDISRTVPNNEILYLIFQVAMLRLYYSSE